MVACRANTFSHISIGKCPSSLLLKQPNVEVYHGVVVRASARDSGGSGSIPGRSISFFRRISAVRYTNYNADKYSYVSTREKN